MWLMMNAIFYVTRIGCRWRMLPKDLLPRQSAVGHYPRWTRRAAGVAEFGHSRFENVAQPIQPRPIKRPAPTAVVSEAE
jgi:hypothetical protein